jgi:glycosyltransferase involved in cell wall biosynthesis
MKIALYVTSWPPGRRANGIVTYTGQLEAALRRAGHDVFILTSEAPDDNVDERVIDLRRIRIPALTRLRRRLLSTLSPTRYQHLAIEQSLVAAVRQVVTQHAVEVVEIEESFGWNRAISELGLVPVVVRLHGPFFLTGRFNDHNLKQQFHGSRAEREGLGIATAHYVTANCEETLQSVKTHYGLPLVRSSIIPTPLDPAPDSMRWRIDKCTKGSILFVGRFDSIKGGDLVLHSFFELAKDDKQASLTFVGPDVGILKGEKIWKFDDYVQHHFPPWFRARIDFRGQMSHAELMPLRTQHHATLIAAQYDTMGYMLLEPMSLGCPLVSTAVGGIPEVISDHRNGLLVPSQDQPAMTEACRKLLADETLATNLGTQAWLDCKNLYGSDPVAKKTIAAYNAAIEAFAAKAS